MAQKAEREPDEQSQKTVLSPMVDRFRSTSELGMGWFSPTVFSCASCLTVYTTALSFSILQVDVTLRAQDRCQLRAGKRKLFGDDGLDGTQDVFITATSGGQAQKGVSYSIFAVVVQLIPIQLGQVLGKVCLHSLQILSLQVPAPSGLKVTYLLPPSRQASRD